MGGIVSRLKTKNTIQRKRKCKIHVGADLVSALFVGIYKTRLPQSLRSIAMTEWGKKWDTLYFSPRIKCENIKEECPP
ncbi:MAG: hypothetical protein KAH35_01850, partial [Candidatus Atribacteria bacterium]|nr:hypothetical protein [Candidatus Atribacteria bacterium]